MPDHAFGIPGMLGSGAAKVGAPPSTPYGFLSNHAVKMHISRIFVKTGSRDRAAIGCAHRYNIG